LNIKSAIASLVTLAYTATPAWAARTTEPTPTSQSDAWLLPLAGLAALLFISRRQGGSSRPDATPSQPRAQPPKHTAAPPAPLHTAAADTRY